MSHIYQKYGIEAICPIHLHQASYSMHNKDIKMMGSLSNCCFKAFLGGIITNCMRQSLKTQIAEVDILKMVKSPVLLFSVFAKYACRDGLWPCGWTLYLPDWPKMTKANRCSHVLSYPQYVQRYYNKMLYSLICFMLLTCLNDDTTLYIPSIWQRCWSRKCWP